MLLHSEYRHSAPLVPAVGSPHPTVLERYPPRSSSMKQLRAMQHADSDLELVRHVWERNTDQVSTQDTACLWTDSACPIH